MAFRISMKKQSVPKGPKPVKRSDYLEWIHSLPCIVTGTIGVQAAHLSAARLPYGHLGRGKGQKASDRWVLPLSPRQHEKQHGMSEMGYWHWAGIDPHLACLVLFGIWSDLGDDAGHALATRLIVNKEGAWLNA